MSDTATIEPKTETINDEDVSFLDELVSGNTAKSTDEKPAKPAKKADAAPPSPPATDATAPPKEESPKTKKTKATVAAPPPPQPPMPPVDYEKIAEASGRGAAAALSKATEKKVPEVTDLMTEEERERFDVIQRMGKDFPKFAGKAKQYADSIQRAATYQQEWERNNPGKAFDPEDGQHDDFYEKNDVTLDDHYYAKTLARMETEYGFEKRESKAEKRLAELEAKEKVRDAEPMIAAAATHARRSFYGMAGQEFANAVDASGNVDEVELKRIVDTDPAKAAIVVASHSVPLFAADLHKLTNGLESFDDENPKHRYISDFAERQQQTIKAMSPSAQADFAKKLNRPEADGAAFVTAEEYNALPPAQRGRYWRLTETDLAILYAAEQAALAQKSVADEESRWESLAKARGYQKVNGALNPPAAAAPTPETPPEQRPHVNSPAATSAPINAHAVGDKNVPQKNHTDSFLADWSR